MSTDVQAKTTPECARAVHTASERIWQGFEAAAGSEAAKRIEAKGASQEAQLAAAAAASRMAAMSRTPLTWEVFAEPRRWRGRWELAPAYPDGRQNREQREAARAAGALVVTATDTEEDIIAALEALRQPPTERV